MKTTPIKSLTILAAGVFAAALLSLRTVPEGNIPAPSFSATVSQVFPSAPAENKILLQTAAGGVWVNNFYKKAEGVWPEMEAVMLAQTPAYDIRYYKTDGSFEIHLETGAARKDRLAAEESLLAILGVGRNELCRLNIYVTYPYDLGDREAFPLSFCGSVLK